MSKKYIRGGRDYTTRPYQGNGRDHYGYGNTKLHPRPISRLERYSAYFAYAVMGAIAALVVFNVIRYFS